MIFRLEGWIMNVMLTDEEAVVVRVAISLNNLFRSLEGGCYRTALFLRLYLKEHHGIQGDTVIGFVNDGQSNIYASHAWYEYDKKITDLAISRPLHQTQNAPGPLMIQGIELEPGHAYTYHRTMPETGQGLVNMIIGNPMLAELFRPQIETHAYASACALSDDLSRTYLDGVEDGWTYEKISDAIMQS